MASANHQGKVKKRVKFWRRSRKRKHPQNLSSQKERRKRTRIQNVTPPSPVKSPRRGSLIWLKRKPSPKKRKKGKEKGADAHSTSGSTLQKARTKQSRISLMREDIAKRKEKRYEEALEEALKKRNQLKAKAKLLARAQNPPPPATDTAPVNPLRAAQLALKEQT